MKNDNSSQENQIAREDEYKTSRLVIDGKTYMQDEYFDDPVAVLRKQEAAETTSAKFEQQEENSLQAAQNRGF